MHLRSRSHKTSDIMDSITGLSSDGQKIVEALKREFKPHRDEITELKNLLQAKQNEVDELRNEISTLKLTVEKLNECVDDADQYERRDTLIFSGTTVPSCNENEHTATLLSDLIKSNLNVIVNPANISTAHRLGKKTAHQGPDNRPIIAKFC